MQNKNTKRVSLDIPIDILDKIDAICKETFITRRKWFIDASKEKLENEMKNKVDRVVRG